MSKSLANQVAVIGVGCTKFGENFDQSLQEMMVEAATGACKDAGVSLDNVKAAWLGTFSPASAEGKPPLLWPMR